MKYDPRISPAILLEKMAGRVKSKQIASKLKKPVSRLRLADFVLTERCNSRCKYCLCWKVKDKAEPTTEEIKSVLDSLANLGVRVVTFAGGEPLLREDLEELVAYTKQYDFDTNITTNGLIATPDRILALAQAGLTVLTFSLDTLDPEIYQLVRGVPLKPVLRNIKKTIDNRSLLKGMELAISLVVSRPTIDSVPEVIRFATNNNMSINIQVVHPAWYSEWFDQDHKYSNQVQFREEDEPRLQALIQEILTMKNEGYNIITNSAYLEGIPSFGTRKQMPKDFHCLSGYDAISINVGLDVYSCIDAGVMGNLRKDKLEDLWFSKKWQEHRQKMYDLKCSKCWIICHTEGLPDNYKAVFRN